MVKLSAIATFSILSSPLCQAFQATSPFLAWSNAPGASLSELAISRPDSNNQPENQLQLESKFTSLCPTDPLSSTTPPALVIFSVSDPKLQNFLKRGFVSAEINREYNSASRNSRLWIDNRPNDGLISDLIENWTSDCHGKVILEEVKKGDKISNVYRGIIDRIYGKRLVIFINTQEEASNFYKRQTSTNTLKDEFLDDLNQSTIDKTDVPPKNSGLFWRYSFLSDYIIVGVLVMVLLFIPPVLLGSYALMSIESPKGLKTKMVGSIVEVKGT